MFETIIEKAIAQAPALAILFGLVVAFLRYLKFRDERFARAIKENGAACHKVQEKSIAAIDRNSQALQANAQIQGQTLEALRRMNGH